MQEIIDSTDCIHLKNSYCNKIKHRIAEGYAMQAHCLNCDHYDKQTGEVD